MQLASHEDRVSEVGSECTLKFHFFFLLLRWQPDERLKAYEWDINSNLKQRLYLSKNTYRMLEVIND